MSPDIASKVNSISVPLLLEWWQQRQLIASVRCTLHRTLPKGDEAYLQAYYRLMEVYSVVKSGGVQVQKEAVRAFAQRESRLLHQRLVEVESGPQLAEQDKRSEKEKIKQELRELHSANDWRLQTLTNIAPSEEAVVRRHLCDIERTLLQTQSA